MGDVNRDLNVNGVLNEPVNRDMDMNDTLNEPKLHQITQEKEATIHETSEIIPHASTTRMHELSFELPDVSFDLSNLSELSNFEFS